MVTNRSIMSTRTRQEVVPAFPRRYKSMRIIDKRRDTELWWWCHCDFQFIGPGARIEKMWRGGGTFKPAVFLFQQVSPLRLTRLPDFLMIINGYHWWKLGRQSDHGHVMAEPMLRRRRYLSFNRHHLHRCAVNTILNASWNATQLVHRRISVHSCR